MIVFIETQTLTNLFQSLSPSSKKQEKEGRGTLLFFPLENHFKKIIMKQLFSFINFSLLHQIETLFFFIRIILNKRKAE